MLAEAVMLTKSVWPLYAGSAALPPTADVGTGTTLLASVCSPEGTAGAAIAEASSEAAVFAIDVATSAAAGVAVATSAASAGGGADNNSSSGCSSEGDAVQLVECGFNTACDFAGHGGSGTDADEGAMLASS